MVLNQQIDEVDKLIEARFRDHHTFEVITSMPGLGVILGAEFLAATGGDMAVFGTPDRLAGFGGVAPVPRDSGKISGNLRRPQRYNRRLQRVFYTSALFSIRYCEGSAFLRSQARRRQASHPSGARPRPPPGQRPLGPSARRAVLPARAANRFGGLTNTIRNPGRLLRLPDRAWGHAVRADRRVAVRGRPGDHAGRPDTDGRAPARARRHVRRAEQRERQRAAAAAGAGRAAAARGC
jgi:hypothetical protein